MKMTITRESRTFLMNQYRYDLELRLSQAKYYLTTEVPIHCLADEIHNRLRYRTALRKLYPEIMRLMLVFYIIDDLYESDESLITDDIKLCIRDGARLLRALGQKC